jgi:drug/metabolite transporter (DMT)-like permease
VIALHKLITDNASHHFIYPARVQLKPIYALELCCLAMLWGASFMFMRIAAPEFGAIPLMAVRVIIASLSLLPFLLLTRGFGEVSQNLKPIFVVGLFSSALPFCLLAYASLSFTAGFTSIINATVPLWSALVAVLVLKQKQPKLAQWGLIVGFCGVVMMVWDKLSIDQLGSVGALIAGLLATLSYGSSVFYSKKTLSHINPLAVATGTMIAASLMLAPFCIGLWPAQPISAKAWTAVIVMGIASTGFAAVLFFRLITNVGPEKAIMVTYLIPVFGMIFGALLLGETVTVEMLAGCGLILGGVSLATGLVKRNPFKRNQTTES